MSQTAGQLAGSLGGLRALLRGSHAGSKRAPAAGLHGLRVATQVPLCEILAGLHGRGHKDKHLFCCYFLPIIKGLLLKKWIYIYVTFTIMVLFYIVKFDWIGVQPCLVSQIQAELAKSERSKADRLDLRQCLKHPV